MADIFQFLLIGLMSISPAAWAGNVVQDGKSSTKLVLSQINKVGEKPDLKNIMEVLIDGCDLQESEGCANIALSLEKGSGVEKDLNKAADLFKKACELGFVHACETERPSLEGSRHGLK